SCTTAYFRVLRSAHIPPSFVRVKPASQVGSFANPWLIFSKYIDAVDANCVNSMLPKWETRLGGAQATMWTHCFAMTQAGRIEPTVQALIQSSTFVYK